MGNSIEKELSCKNVLSVELVAAYVRVSTQEQKLHGLSLDAQKQKLTGYAEEHNMKIVEWYIDEGVSGRKLIRKRPELQRMIQDAEKRKFTRIIFIKLDRFFRSIGEYHEAMKRIDPVIWTATEEKYDLSTAQGRMLVNMKLTIAEMEADTAGERVNLVNEYKLSTGQPLTGSVPFCYMITKGENGRKKIVKDPEMEEITEDILEHFQMHQSIHKTVLYINAKYKLEIMYKTIANLLRNTLLYGEYRGNPNYVADPYIDKDTFNRMQQMITRNDKANTRNREYIFGGLVRCPECGNLLRGTTNHNKGKNGKTYIYKMYRCSRWAVARTCSYNKCVNENTLEKLMLANVEQYLADAKIKAAEVKDSDAFRIPQKNIEDVEGQIDRLNYSWQTGKIRKVEQYEKDFNALMQKLEEAKAEQSVVYVKDFSKIDAIIQSGWKEIYKALDDAHRRAFWRSFVDSIEVDWMGAEKKIKRVNFF
ncbi:recombinase family protein [Succinimonas sp.]|uniref:recombinase family protein n=1 Tax=Succinimonas sp. TaxID=1936151 RepID=UPI00386C3BC7